jgi:hypothetical protein
MIAIAACTRRVSSTTIRRGGGRDDGARCGGFAYANFEHTFWLIRTVHPLFGIFIRATGLERSPAGCGGVMTRYRTPQGAGGRRYWHGPRLA